MPGDVVLASRGLLTPGYAVPKRQGYGIAKPGTSPWRGAAEAGEEINDAYLNAWPIQQTNWNRNANRRAYAKCVWAYKGHQPYSACVDLITGCILTNGEDPQRRPWRCVPARDQNDEPLKNPDESQLEPWYRFVGNCHPMENFESMLVPIITDAVASNHCITEVALSPILNQYGDPQPGALYLFPQSEIVPKVDAHGELDLAKPFWQLRPGMEPKGFSWLQALQIKHGTMRGAGILPMTPLDGIEVNVESAIESQKLIRSFFRTGGKMGMIFEKDNWSKEEAEEFINWIREQFTNTDLAHQPFAIWGGLTIHPPIESKHDFNDFLAVMSANKEETASRFQTDPRLIAAGEKGSALGNKGERQEIWYELLMGPVNSRKRNFGRQLTHQLFRQGFGITDWDLELVAFRTPQDADSMQKIATGYMNATQAGLMNWQRLADLNVARRRVDSNLDDVLESELATWPRPFLRGMPDPTLQADPTQIDPETGLPITVSTKGGQKPLPTTPPGPNGNPTPAKAPPAIAKRTGPEELGEVVTATRGLTKTQKRTDYDSIRAHLDGWENETNAALLEPLKAALAKSRDAMEKLYGQKGSYQELKKANLLPGFGQIAADFRARLKDFHQASIDHAEKEIKAAKFDVTAKREQRGSIGDDSREAGPADTADRLELFGQTKFDDIYNTIVRDQRQLFLDGFDEGWSRKEFVAELQAKGETRAESLLSNVVRTAAVDVFNRARQTVGERAGINWYEWSAILEDRTCKVCEILGKPPLQIAASDSRLARITPPKPHPQCRCILGFGDPSEDFSTDSQQLTRALNAMDDAKGRSRKG